MRHSGFLKMLAAATMTSIGAVAAIGAVPLSVGMVVIDTSGQRVGQITQVENGRAVIATGSHKVALPVGSFAMGGQSPIIAMTRGELDAAADRTAIDNAAALRARLMPGVAISGSGGMLVGTIKSVAADYIVLRTANGDARIPVASVNDAATGLQIGMTAAQFRNAMAT